LTTLPPFQINLGNYSFVWEDIGGSYDVYTYGRADSHVCRVFPYKPGDKDLLSNKMYTVKAAGYPGIGNLEQMVKGADLIEYVDSIRRGRGM